MRENWKNNNDLFIEKLVKYKVKCKYCGHVIIMIYKPFCICDWCGHIVYRSKKDEFKYKLKKITKKVD